MSDKIEFRAAMEFAYGVPRALIPGVVRIVANNPSPFTYKPSMLDACILILP